MIQCPYCLESVEPATRQQGRVTQYVCPECHQPVARDFVESRAPNTTIGLIGFSGHGKTVFIHYLFYLLSHLKNEWPDYYYKSLDDHTDRIVYEQVPRLRKESVLPDSTPANFPLPALLLHHNFPGHGDRFVTVYDTAGEVFEQTQTITDQGRYVAHADTVFFLVSLADLGESWGDRLELLLQKYVRAAHDHMRVELKQRQRLVVVFTKADLLLGAETERPLPKELVEYLQAGTYETYRALGSGTGKALREASTRIESWLGKSGCRAFVSMARDSFKDVAFTLVSATGAAPEGQKLPTRLEPKDPKRVLDPLLWALERSWATAEAPKPLPKPPLRPRPLSSNSTTGSVMPRAPVVLNSSPESAEPRIRFFNPKARFERLVSHRLGGVAVSITWLSLLFALWLILAPKTTIVSLVASLALGIAALANPCILLPAHDEFENVGNLGALAIIMAFVLTGLSVLVGFIPIYIISRISSSFDVWPYGLHYSIGWMLLSIGTVVRRLQWLVRRSPNLEEGGGH